MAEQLKNSLDNPTSTLAATITSGATSFDVASGQGSRFPASGNFRIKLTSATDDSVYELCLVGARSTDTLSSITRGIEGTTAQAFTAGAHVDLVVTTAGLAQWAAETSQPLDSDLTAFAALSPANDDVVQRKAGAWTNRTIAQLLTDLAAPGTTFQPLDSDLTAVAGLSPTNDDVIQRKAGAWTNRTLAQLIADLAALGTTFQPLDSDLSAVAALTTTSFGRGLLELANAAALLSAAGGAAAARTLTAGDGLSGGGDLSADRTFTVNVDGSTLEISTDALRVKAAGILASHIGDAELAALAGLTSAADALPYFTGSGTAALATLTSFARTLIDDANAAAARATLDVPSNAEAILDAIVDAKGDLIAATAADTVARLPVGTNGHVLTADSAEATGIKWAAAAGGGAPTDATYIVQTANGSLSAEQALSALATGLLKNATGTGVLSIAAAGTDYYAPGGTDVAVADGGTGASTAAGARTNLGLVIGTDVQAYDADLAALAGLPGGRVDLKPSSGEYMTCQWAAGNSTSNGGNDEMYPMALWVPASMSFDRVAIRVDTAAASAVIRLGAYSATAENKPGTLLDDFGTVDASTTGVKTITISKTYGPGLIWLVAVHQVGACRCRAFETSKRTGPMNPVSSDTLTFETPGQNFYRVTSVSGALPASPTWAFLGNSDARTPIIGLRAA